ncbi:MAG TPA: NAD(P)/FAD-dependent oxidoreductase [Ramlibacter sp.]|uniref:flavin-containing monooxygenase n=1 Tax=Ramlibacter sp. TaxID=1917967 RepID=UPI002C9E6C9E|nr:NAD(P)/FAD-dependent oxidoreductase [Ramlibacter sp.]HVZ44114.1 NAD(P)/FAD-dependent oxidoreductase [Ramlibacter sp.]
MKDSTIDTLVVGAGQAGVAMSEHLTRQEIPHLVLERSRIAERWRTGRWDSLVANGPAWHDRFPGLEFEDLDPDAFASKDRVARYFEDYARKFEAPIRTGVEVTSVRRIPGDPRFVAQTSEGEIRANRVVVATGPFQQPLVPAIAPKDDGLYQIHSADYKNPHQMPEGGVLVVGAGSSGVQIADELNRAGRKVYLSVGPHDRLPRSYRNRDYCWWLGVLGEWDKDTPAEGREHVTIAVSGVRGGETIDFRRLGQQGITLVGMTAGVSERIVRFDGNLAGDIARGDESYFAMLDAADAYAKRNGVDLPADPAARELPPLPKCVTQPLLELDLRKAGIRSIIWATGYTADYRWLPENALDAKGKPRHQRGISAEPGIYFLGLSWLSRRGSAFIWGVWHDAKHIADHIGIQRKYLAYRDASQRRGAAAA